MSVMLLIGPANSGKGTLASRLRKEGYETITVSELLRVHNVQIPTDGSLVPDDVVVPLIKKEVDSTKGILVLDGYPRTLEQAEELYNYDIKVNRVVVLDVPLETLIERSHDRVICKNCRETYTLTDFKRPKVEGVCDKCGANPIELVKREEDTDEVVIKRYNDYHDTLKDILSVFKKHKARIIKIYGSKPYSLMEVLY